VLPLSITGPLGEKSEAYLDNWWKFITKWLLRIKFYFENNSIFTAERLKLIMFELDGVEQDVESFKKVNKLTILMRKRSFIEGSSEYDKKGVETEIKLNVCLPCWIS
jgi:hypothetical protein